jgi:hypothetical protein
MHVRYGIDRRAEAQDGVCPGRPAVIGQGGIKDAAKPRGSIAVGRGGDVGGAGRKTGKCLRIGDASVS